MIKQVKSLKLHKDKIWDLGELNGLLATASTDRCIKIVNLNKEAFQLVDELDDTVHKKTVRSVAWRPNSSTLAAGSFDSTVSIWSRMEVSDDYTLPTTNFEMELMAIIEGHENEVKSVAWSHDGLFLASCSRDKSVWIWETDEMGEEYECVSVLQEHSQDVKHVVWHPSMHLLASSSYDDTVRIWKESDDDWEAAAVLNGHEGTVWCSDFEKSETKVRLCSGSDDKTVRVWKYLGDNEDDEQKWECEAILPQVHSRSVYSVTWGENGLIASTGSDGLLVIYREIDGQWEVLNKKEQCHGTQEANVVKWMAVGEKSLLATGGDDGHVNIWEDFGP